MNQKLGIIYITINIIDKKMYVGQTKRLLKERYREHLRPKDTKLLYRAIKKYGLNNFKWISFSCPKEDLDWTETFLIKELNTLVPNGYNLDYGGIKNKKFTKETKIKMSKARKEIIISEETRKKLSLAGMGRKHTNETKEKLSKLRQGKKNPFYRKKHSKKTKKYLSSYHKNNPIKYWLGKKMSAEIRKKMSDSRIKYYKKLKNPK